MAVADSSQAYEQPAKGVSIPEPVAMEKMSYAEQYDYLVSQPKGSVNFKKPCKKPSLEAQVRGSSLNACTCSNPPKLCDHLGYLVN